MEDMAHYCDNVVVMSASKIFKVGTVDEVFSDAEAIAGNGLDVPSVSKIAQRLIDRGVDLKGKLYTVEGVRDAIKEYIGRCGK
jgi:energy-coupling factor transport system ATP-binding protein